MRTVLVTGTAGFIGMHVAKALLDQGDKVIGVDNLNQYYDIRLKIARLSQLEPYENFTFYQRDISEELKIEEDIDVICHLAAQPGVRYSIENPPIYVRANSVGTFNIFELARKKKIPHVVFASSSSIYGHQETAPFHEGQKVHKPISLYAATKRSTELYAHSYHHLYDINMTGLRFFTVYGPWGRPDMAPFKFLKKILNDEQIDIYNHGKMKRDFTYVGDIVTGVLSAIDKPMGFEIMNLARGETVELMDFVRHLEESAGKEAKKNFVEYQAGDVYLTSGDITKAKEKLGYEPKTSIKEGVQQFVDWYKEHYGIQEIVNTQETPNKANEANRLE